MPEPIASLRLHATGEEVRELQDELNTLGYHIPATEREEQSFGIGTRDAVRAFQVNQNTLPTGEADPATRELISRRTRLLGLEENRVEGRVLLENGRPARGLKIDVVAPVVGAEQETIGSAVTDDDGYYSIDYGGTTPPHVIELHAQASEEGGFRAPIAGGIRPAKLEVRNLIAPLELASAKPEFARLFADLQETLRSQADEDRRIEVADLQEGSERRDLTLLHGATGWDAKLIAMAATSARLEAATNVPQEALYGLFRQGLPYDEQQLACLSADAVSASLTQAKATGLIGLDDEELRRSAEAFEAFAVARRRNVAAIGANNTFGELFEASGLEPEKRQKFEDLYFSTDKEGAAFWEDVENREFTAKEVQELRLQGKLAFLTFNNIALADSLKQILSEDDDDSLDRLVDKGFHQPKMWRDRLHELAGDDEERLAELVPSAFEGKQVEQRVESYADELARKVRLSYPTKTLGRMVRDGELPFTEAEDHLRVPVAELLDRAAKLGHRVGRKPFAAVLREHHAELFEEIDADLVDSTTETVKRLHRLYQITPGDEALRILLERGFGSAQDILAYDYDQFIDKYAKDFPTPSDARLVHKKAQQVVSVVYSFFSTAKQLDRSPAIYALSSAQDGSRERVRAEMKGRFPTLETLFGSLDFCECEHCRSVLSPAAYFVDLLKFLDPDSPQWKGFLSVWESRSEEGYLESGYRMPYDELVERRPDLPHLQLTCENTKTALPYIDVVNEILEFIVAAGKLSLDAVRDTGSEDSADLLAEPQHMIPRAYDRLRKARFPVGLPYDHWLETSRRFCEHFEFAFTDVLRAFSSPDALESETGGHGLAAVFQESLGLTPVESKMLTSAESIAAWHELYGFASRDEARQGLSHAKEISRRLQISHHELTELVRTSFVNPNLETLDVLRRLGIDVSDVYRFKGHEAYEPLSPEESLAFRARLDRLTATFEDFDAAAWLDEAWDTGQFDSIVVLYSKEAGCDFASTSLRLATGEEVDDLVIVKLNLFVRLRRRLNWTIEELDCALRACLPAALQPLTIDNLGDALRTAMLSLSHQSELASSLHLGRGALREIPVIWSRIDTYGRDSFYARLFLAPSVLKNDAVFDHPLGRYLESGTPLQEHLLAVQGALGLTTREVERVLSSRGSSLEDAELDLDTVSLLLRHRLLADGLRMSVDELLTLSELVGVDPFAALAPGVVEVLADDHPYVSTIRFVEIAKAVQAIGVKVEDLDYLVRHRFVPLGDREWPAVERAAVVGDLASQLRRVDMAHGEPTEAEVASDDWLLEKLSLVFPPNLVDTFVSLWTGTIETTVSQDVPPQDALDTLDESVRVKGVSAVFYDNVRQQQSLTFVGVPTERIVQDLGLEHDDAVFRALLDKVRKEVLATIQSNFMQFLPEDRIDEIFTLPDAKDPAAYQQQNLRRRSALLAALMPFLRNRLVHQIIVEVIGGRVDASPDLLEALIGRVDILRDASGENAPLLTAFAAAAESGLTAWSYSTADASGPAVETTVAEISMDTVEENAGSARIVGQFEPPETGPYRFFVKAGHRGGRCRLTLFGDGSVELIHFEATQDDEERSEVVELRAGVQYTLTAVGLSLGGGGFSIQVQSIGLPKGSLSRLPLVPARSAERVEHAWILLNKALEFAATLGLNRRELEYAVRALELDLAGLPTAPGQNPDVGPLVDGFLRVFEYVALKSEISADSTGLLDVLEAASTEHHGEGFERFADLVRQRPTRVSEAAEKLGLDVRDLASIPNLKRIWKVLELADALGVSPADLERWATPEPDSVTARDIRNTIRSGMSEDGWRRTARAIFNDLRKAQRDALVAYVMNTRGFERVEELYEHLLIDPGMEPVVETSRIQLAISSVQLFIQRCLLNLEERVHPAAINRRHWLWMERYRVWEANRKIFLYPENWLEPEFRDDKSHLFQELEGALLEGDVSQDLADDAFFHYLTKLEELARLEIVSMYSQEDLYDPLSNVLHVLGRSYGLPHKYYYRRYENRVWTPWFPVEAEIEGDHTVMTIWRNRPYIFWVTFLEKAQRESDKQPTTGGTVADMSLGAVANELAGRPRKRVEVQLNCVSFAEGRWSERVSTEFIDPLGTTVDPDFSAKEVFVHVSNESRSPTQDGAVLIHLGGPIQKAFRLASRNAKPSIVDAEPPQPLKLTGLSKGTGEYHGTGPLSVSFLRKLVKENGKVTNREVPTLGILRKGSGYSIVTTANKFAREDTDIGALVVPFFYQDARNTFFVEPELVETTIEEWEEWVVPAPKPKPKPVPISIFEPTVEPPPILPFDPRGPRPGPIPFDPRDPRPGPIPFDLDPLQPRFEGPRGILPQEDWLTNPTTILTFGEELIGGSGGLGATLAPRVTTVAPDLDVGADLGVPVDGGRLAEVPTGVRPVELLPLEPGSDVPSDLIVTFGRPSGLGPDPISNLLAGGGVNVVGSGGVSDALVERLAGIDALSRASGSIGGFQ